MRIYVYYMCEYLLVRSECMDDSGSCRMAFRCFRTRCCCVWCGYAINNFATKLGNIDRVHSTFNLSVCCCAYIDCAHSSANHLHAIRIFAYVDNTVRADGKLVAFDPPPVVEEGLAMMVRVQYGRNCESRWWQRTVFCETHMHDIFRAG